MTARISIGHVLADVEVLHHARDADWKRRSVEGRNLADSASAGE
jgi:hypothetical protein